MPYPLLAVALEEAWYDHGWPESFAATAVKMRRTLIGDRKVSSRHTYLKAGVILGQNRDNFSLAGATV
jgi:hypothetical protein